MQGILGMAGAAEELPSLPDHPDYILGYVIAALDTASKVPLTYLKEPLVLKQGPRAQAVREAVRSLSLVNSQWREATVTIVHGSVATIISPPELLSLKLKAQALDLTPVHESFLKAIREKYGH